MHARGPRDHTRAHYFMKLQEDITRIISENCYIFLNHYEDNDMEYKWHTIYKKGEIIKISF